MDCIEIVENRRILIVDDNVSIHEDFRKILVPGSPPADLTAIETELFGWHAEDALDIEFKLDYATTGEDALTKVRRAVGVDQPFAVAFVDMRLGAGWDGVQTIGHLWEADPRLQAVICSAYSDHSWRQIVHELGLTDRLLILKKPFGGIEILQMAMALSTKWNLAVAMATEQDSADQLVASVIEEMNAKGIVAPAGMRL